MKKKFAVFIMITLTGLNSRSQSPEQLLNDWSARSPIEKIYLHLDRDSYIAGETIWFKAYLYSDYQPDTISTSLYTELVNDSGRVINRSILPVLLGTASGQLEMPATLTKGNYTVRAYTPTMLNHDAAFIYQRSIFVYGKNTIQSPKEKKLRLEFFPEGGNFVSGLTNTLAFKATDENGMPVAVNGSVFNDKNEKVTGFTTYHDGMGLLDLPAAASSTYYAMTDGDPQKFSLPVPTSKGIALTVIPHPQGHFFELKQKKDDPAFQVSYMVGQMQHHLVFRQDFKTFKEQFQGVIDTRNLHSGILQITYFNKDNQPLAERLCFVNNKEYLQRGELITDTISFQGKARNRISIQLKDTVQGSFSVSVSDADYALKPMREENIFSALLLTSDLKGYIHEPAYYFSADNDSVQTALDLVMMTNGWRRFKWIELSKLPPSNFKDPSYITLSGKVTLRDSKKPFALKPLLLMLITADSTRRIQMISTDQLGYFKLDSMLFFGRSKVFLSDIRGKKSQYIDIHLSADSLNRSFSLPKVPVNPFQPIVYEKQGKMGIDFDAIIKANGVMLQGVTVKTRKKTLVEQLDEKYAKGAFEGDANKVFDLVNNKGAEPYNNIFDYLKMQLPSLTVVDANAVLGDGPASSTSSIKLYYRQSMSGSVSSMGPIPMVLYLDEVETDADVIANIPANQVAMVKVYSTFVGAGGNGAGGVLAIYTKKGADMNDMMVNAADMIPYNGYTVTKEFYEPDYKANPSEKNKTDNRITLAWRPDILINNINPKIPVTFYNSDRTKSYRIVIEGMTLDGKMLMIEKVVGTKGF
ncbi:MAG TPA: hypothetical protein VGO58_02155 [Chitinophagaceae bacterium]|jgi:hypothetical protein|nr:hypothetical protein [Chitinophagaceae bacterium]